MKRSIGICGLAVFSGCTFISEQEVAYRKGGIAGCDDVWYLDLDEDGYGDNNVSVQSCSRPSENYVQEAGDCDDDNSNIGPHIIEDCGTNFDEDCDGTLNGNGENDPENCTVWYMDADGDGEGADNGSICDCISDTTYPSSTPGDCDDTDPAVNSNAEEICGDGVDNNCDGSANGCGLESPYSLENDIFYVGDVSKDYVGAGLTSGILLGDSKGVVVAILAIEADSIVDNVGRVDIVELEFREFDETDPAPEFFSSETRIWGTEVSSFGSSLIGDQDLNGDGDHDLLIGASYATVSGNVGVGVVSVFLGPLQGEKTLDDADFLFTGENSNDRFGDSASIRAAQQKVWIGAPNYDDPTVNGGAVFIFAIEDGAVQSNSSAIQINSEISTSRFGSSISSSVDANGDGVDDIAVGAMGFGSSKGSAYVFWGSVSSGRSAQDADVIIRGDEPLAEIGKNIDFVGDLTGSGYPELVLASSSLDKLFLHSANESGELQTANASITIQGPADSSAGSSFENIGDFNGDGQDDFAIGGNIASVVYLLYGPLSGDYDLATDAVILEDRGDDQVGISLTSVGDINGDGLSEFLIGAQISSSNRFKSGTVFLVEGFGL